jgi:dynein heavy chain
MVNEADMSKYDEFRYAVTKKYFEDCGGMGAIEERPLVFNQFMVST